MADSFAAAAKTELQNVKQSLEEIDNQIQTLLNKQSSLRERKQFLTKYLKSFAEKQNTAYDWSSEEFSWSSELKEKSESAFGINSFRPNQLEAMNTTMSGLDCILIMPTGAGKSLCYQLPAMLSEGMTLVISPLVSLMEDQIMSLEKLNISAVMLNASSEKESVSSVYADMTRHPCSLRLLYVTPEKLAKSRRFMNKLEKSYKAGCLSRIAIDEVHCCSQWGHDFRPDYKFLGILKKQFPKVPILGLTATASTHVLADVQKMLQLSHAQVYKGSFNRTNLYYRVVLKPASHDDCLDKIYTLIDANFKGQSGIIYCISRKETVTVTEDLNKRGIKSACYHSDLVPSMRSNIHSRWSSGRIQVIVATIAFGMGIDKPDVRFVIHHSLSKSMESYYQESGRAGRDGCRADCILLYRLADVFRQSCMVFTETTGLDKLYRMVEYCQDQSTCRRKLIAGHFSEVWKESTCEEMCDHCAVENGNPNICSTDDLALNSSNTDTDVQLIYEILDNASKKDTRLTGQKLLDAMVGKGPTPYRGRASSKFTRIQCQYLIGNLLTCGGIREDFHFTPYSTISYLVMGSGCSLTSVGDGDDVEMVDMQEDSDNSVKREESSNEENLKVEDIAGSGDKLVKRKKTDEINNLNAKAKKGSDVNDIVELSE